MSVVQHTVRVLEAALANADAAADLVANAGGGGGVTSFNGRTGAVVLTSTDVTNALGDANIAYTDVANAFTKAQTITVTDNVTNALTQILTLDHSSTSTPTTGFGGYLLLEADSASVAGRQVAEFDWSWSTATDASRKGRLIAAVYDTSKRECIRCDTDGTAGQVSFFGAGSYGSGDGLLFLNNATTAATTAPSGGVILESVSGALNIFGLGATVTAIDSATTTTTNVGNLYHQTSGTAGVGFGGSLIHALDSAAVADRNTVEIDWTWVSATDASRKPRIQWKLTDGAAGQQEALRMETDGTLAIVGVCGAVTATTMMTVNPGADNYVGLAVKANSGTQSADLTDWRDSSNNTISFINSSGQPTFGVRDAATTTISTGATFRHNSTATPGVGFGTSQLFLLDSATVANETAMEFDWTWATATDASRKPRTLWKLTDGAAGQKEALRMETDGTLAISGVGGAVTTTTMMTVNPGSDSYVGLAVLANSASTSANLQEWRVSGPTVLARVTSKGEFSNPIGAATNESFGAGAIPAAATGTNNAVFGNAAGSGITGGSHNTFVGYQAGKGLSSANNCVAIGYQSALNANAGSNTSIGYQSLAAVSAGNTCTAIGFQALQNVAANGNTAVGSSAGSVTLSSGANNVLLGLSADTQAAASTNGVALGNAAKCQSNEFALGPNVNFQTIYVLSSTSTLRQRADFTASNIDNTDATRKYHLDFNIWDTAARKYFSAEASGSAAKISFFGASVVLQQNTTGTTTGFTQDGGTAVNSGSTFTGNTGATAYTIGDIVLALKNYGLLAA